MNYEQKMQKDCAIIYHYSYIKIKNLNYQNKDCTSRILNTLAPVFRLHNINFKLSTSSHKLKWLLSTEKPIINTGFKDL